jgi:hypothetical protein
MVMQECGVLSFPVMGSVEDKLLLVYGSHSEK